MTRIIPISVNKPVRIDNNAVSSCLNKRTGYNPVFCAGPKVIESEWVIGKINWIGDMINPAWQRGISGITALFTQPLFDLYNKNTDEKTRQTSCARTLGKIIAGTTTGVLIREICIRAMNHFTQNAATEAELVRKAISKGKTHIKKTHFKPIEQCLLPKNALKASFKEIKNYRNTVGTLAAVGIMIFTNFLIDAPLTTYLTNIFVKKFNKTADDSAKIPVEGGKK